VNRDENEKSDLGSDFTGRCRKQQRLLCMGPTTLKKSDERTILLLMLGFRVYTSCVVTPGCTIAVRVMGSTEIFFMRDMSITMPPSARHAPP
jgi:hypothetical protein